MPDLLTYAPSDNAVYYRPDKRVHFGKLVCGFFIAAVCIAIGSFFYARLQFSINALIPRLGAPVVASIAVGLLALIPIQMGRVQIQWLVACTATLLSLFALYVMWGVWLHEVIATWKQPVPYWLLVKHPIAEVRFIQLISTIGTWKYGDEQYRGPILIAIWIAEMCIVMAGGILIPLKGVYVAKVTCRECGSECVTVPDLPRFAVDRQSEFLGAIERRQFDLMAGHACPEYVDEPELALHLLSCGSCMQTHVLTVNRLECHRTGQGKLIVVPRTQIKQLMLPREEAERLIIACAGIQIEREKESASSPESV